MIRLSEPAEWLKAYLASTAEKRIANQMPVFGVNTFTDIAYLSDDNPAHTLDVYRPKNPPGALPVILVVHGGAWVGGSKADNKNFGMYLASKGFAVVNMDFTTAVHNHLRTQIEDIIYCFHWIQRNSRQYKFDMRNVFLCGDSSGAHLILLSYIVNTSDTLRMLYKTEPADLAVRGIGLISPVADLQLITKYKPFAERLFGEKPAESPYYYCASLQDTLRASISLPPVFLVGAQEDPFFSGTLWTHHLLTKRNAEHTFRTFPKGQQQKLPHAFAVHYPEYGESMTANNEMTAFFKQQTV